MSAGKAYILAYERFRTRVCGAVGIRFMELLLPLLLVAVDYVSVVSAVLTASLIRNYIMLPYFAIDIKPFAISGIYIYIIMPTAYILFMNFDNLYTRRLLFWQQVEKIFKVSVYAMLTILVVMYLTKYTIVASRLLLVLSFIICFVYLIFSKYLFKKILTMAGLWEIPIVLIGAGKTAELLVNAFRSDNGLGYKIVGLLEDNPEKMAITDYPVLGTFDHAEEAVRKTGVKKVIIAAPGLNREKLLNLVFRLQPYVAHISFVPDLFGVPVGDMQMDTLFNEKAVLLHIRNNLANEYNRFVKQIFDFIGALVGMLFALPIIMLIAVCIYIDNPGPVIFAHKRIGKDGRVFPCYKFRTMTANAEAELKKYLAKNAAAREEWQRDFKLKDDPRITRVGRFLRKTSLDELPQLFNVIMGQMSLVGPRPIVTEEIAKYEELVYDYYLVKPGITGLWQVSGRNDINYRKRVELDSWYIRNWSLWLDVMLLLSTVRIVLNRDGAY